MKKLTLALDALRVESFATDRVETATGTVAGHALPIAPKTDLRGDCASHIDACPTRGCSFEGGYTCVDTCGATYEFSCKLTADCLV